jgi:undecaprenyl-diphosphatase
MNDRLEDLINGLSGRWHALDTVMKLTATDLIIAVAVVLLALWFWPGRSADRATNQRVVIAAILAALGALAAGALIGALHPEARPFVTDPDARLLIHHAADNGLPSDHALASFAVAGAVLWWRRLAGLALLLLAVLIGIARVYAGVHWPGDIAAGALVGLLAGSLAARTVPWWAGPQRWGGRFLPPHLIGRP